MSPSCKRPNTLALKALIIAATAAVTAQPALANLPERDTINGFFNSPIKPPALPAYENYPSGGDWDLITHTDFPDDPEHTDFPDDPEGRAGGSIFKPFRPLLGNNEDAPQDPGFPPAPRVRFSFDEDTFNNPIIPGDYFAPISGDALPGGGALSVQLPPEPPAPIPAPAAPILLVGLAAAATRRRR